MLPWCNHVAAHLLMPMLVLSRWAKGQISPQCPWRLGSMYAAAGALQELHCALHGLQGTACCLRGRAAPGLVLFMGCCGG